MVCEMGGKWPYNYCFVRCCLQNLLKTACRILVQYPLVFFFMRFVSVHMVLPYSSTDIATAWKKSRFILSERSDFYMIDNLSITVHAFTRRMFISLSVDEILLPRYLNWSTNFEVEMASSLWKYMIFFLFAFTQRQMLSAACSGLCSKHSAWGGVFARSSRSSTWSASVMVSARFRFLFCFLVLKHSFIISIDFRST